MVEPVLPRRAAPVGACRHDAVVHLLRQPRGEPEGRIEMNLSVLVPVNVHAHTHLLSMCVRMCKRMCICMRMRMWITYPGRGSPTRGWRRIESGGTSTTISSSSASEE